MYSSGGNVLFNLGTYEVVLIVLAVAYVVLVPLMSLLVARRTARRLAQEKNGKQLSP